MRRSILMGFVLLTLLGCQLPPDQDTYRPLREHGGRRPNFDELVARARRQSDAATEAYFGNNWGDLEDVSKALEQTARLLPTAQEKPEAKMEQVRRLSGEVSRDAGRVNEAVKEIQKLSGPEREKKITEVNAILTSISKAVRSLPRVAEKE